MAGKPRIVTSAPGKKRPRVVRQEDFSMVLSKDEPEKEPEHVVFKGLKGTRETKVDEIPPLEEVGTEVTAEKLRESALADITPLEKGKGFNVPPEGKREGEPEGVHKKLRKLFGMP